MFLGYKQILHLADKALDDGLCFPPQCPFALSPLRYWPPFSSSGVLGTMTLPAAEPLHRLCCVVTRLDKNTYDTVGGTLPSSCLLIS